MKKLFQIIYDSFRLAFQQLRTNKLRSFLSFLGITIGIFCIIAVQSAVDSLESSILNIFGGMSEEILMIDVFPWDEDPQQNYWKYFRRPSPTFTEFELLRNKLDLAETTAFMVGMDNRLLKYKSNSIEGSFIMGTTDNFPDVQEMEIEKGRFFTKSEYERGDTKIIIGAEVAKQLFDQVDPIGKEIKMLGQKFKVVGVLKSEGENPFGAQQMDVVVWMSVYTAKRFINTNGKSRFSAAKLIYIKPKEGVEADELRDEITGAMRGIRRLKPREDDNFSINSIAQLTGIIEGFFGVVKLVGIVIGFFAIVVGLVSVANIMFVSVKERTSIIGIKKALGAKRIVILLEFLIEAIFLCIIGGLFGLLLVFLSMKLITAAIDFPMFLSVKNALVGVFLSVIIGVIAGMLPALRASGMDPVEAIRS